MPAEEAEVVEICLVPGVDEVPRMAEVEEELAVLTERTTKGEEVLLSPGAVAELPTVLLLRKACVTLEEVEVSFQLVMVEAHLSKTILKQMNEVVEPRCLLFS